jgi:hypothetical protein
MTLRYIVLTVKLALCRPRSQELVSEVAALFQRSENAEQTVPGFLSTILKRID